MAILAGGWPNLKEIKYFDLRLCHNHELLLWSENAEIKTQMN